MADSYNNAFVYSGIWRDTQEAWQTNIGQVWFTSAARDACANFIISVHPDDCTELVVADLYFDADWLPVDYQYEKEVVENGYEAQTLIRQVIKRYHRFRVVVDLGMRNYVHEMVGRMVRLNGQWKASPSTPNLFAATSEIYDLSIEEEELGPIDDLVVMTLAFRTELNANTDTFGATACCIDIYEDPPAEDPCTGLPGSGGSEGCDVTTTISVSEAGGTLTATVANYTGTPTIRWTFYPYGGGASIVLAQNSTTVPVGESGTYRATLVECGIFDEYVHLDPCLGFRVTARQDTATTIIADLTPSTASATYQWYESDGGGGWTLLVGETGMTLDASTHGTNTYRVVVTGSGDWSGCETEDTIEFTLGAACIMTVDLAIAGSEITATVADAPGAVLFDWDIDRGDGLGFVSLFTDVSNATIDTDGAGLYRVTAKSAGCEVTDQILYLDPCASFRVYINSLTPHCTYATLAASLVNCAEMSPVIEWYQNTGSGWTHLGSGMTMDINNEGIVRVEATCGACISTDELWFCVKPDTSLCYERWQATSQTDEFVITEFVLPNPATLTVNEISELLDVWVNQVHMVYDPGGTLMNGYDIDFANNKIIFNRTWYTGSYFEARYDCGCS